MEDLEKIHFTGTIWRPPYEAYSVLLQATVGCSHHACKFCSLYGGLRFRLAPREEIESDLRIIAKYQPRARRLFLVGSQSLRSQLRTDGASARSDPGSPAEGADRRDVRPDYGHSHEDGRGAVGPAGAGRHGHQHRNGDGRRSYTGLHEQGNDGSGDRGAVPQAGCGGYRVLLYLHDGARRGR